MDTNHFNLLKSCKIFSSLDDNEIKNLLKKFTECKIKKNQILFKKGDVSKNIYLLVEGKIATYLNPKPKERIFLNEYLPGSLIGEISALSLEPRWATAKAVKDSTLLKLSSKEFIDLCKKNNAVSLELVNTSFRHSRNIIKSITEKQQSNKHIVIIPANDEINLENFYENLSAHKTNHSDLILISDRQVQNKNIAEIKEYLTQLDSEHKIFLYFLTAQDSTLTKLCFGQLKIDMIYLVAFADEKISISEDTKIHIDINKYRIKPELILLHKNKNKPPKKTAQWLNELAFNLHHHIRIEVETDWQRLLRFMTGNAVGIVLGGGGLRCWAQLGALMALQKLKIPIDAIGGTSAGAVIAGYYALNQSLKNLQPMKELSQLTNQATRIKNLTWPSASLFSGKDYTLKLKEIFKNVRIENLWIPCFAVSTNLYKNKQIISRKGFLWKIIRSSTAVPLVFPPVVINGKLRLDGGLLNNLPVDIMKKIISNKNKIIAVELTHNNEDNNNYNFPPILPFWQVLFNKLKISHQNYFFPHFIDMFLKSLLAGASIKQEENGKLADILISPEIAEFNLLNVTDKDHVKLIKIGYRATMKKCRVG